MASKEIIRYANEASRPGADRAGEYYFFCKEKVAEWFANPGVQPDNNDVVIDDGSADDGRHPLKGEKVWLMVTRMQEYITDMEANNNAKLNTILSLAVNTDVRR